MLETIASYIGLQATGLPPATVLLAGATLMMAYTIFGITGFGSAIIAMPFLTQLMPLQRAVPIMLVCDLVAGLLLGAANRSSVDMPELRRLVPWMLAGMLVGLALLLYAPERPLLIVLGTGVLVYSLWRLLSADVFRPLGAGWAVPLGMAGGGFTALFGTGGPLYTIYLAGRLQDRNQLRATVGTLIMLTGLTRLLMFSVAGLLLNRAVFALALWMLPCGLAGVRIGSWLRLRVPPVYIARLLWTVLILGSVSLLLKALRD
jgi:uncharacterized membrane protein YfcA